MQSVFDYAKTLKSEYSADINQYSLVRNLNGRWHAVSLLSMLKPYKVNAALKSVFFGTKPKRTVVRNQFSNYAKTLKGEYSAEISFLWYET